MADRLLLGSDIENYEGLEFLSGIQRVTRDAHIGLTDRLAPEGIDVVPFRTRVERRQQHVFRHPYFVDDPVLHERRRRLDELDAFLILDVNLKADYRAIYLANQQRRRPVLGLVHDIIPLLDATKFEPSMRLEFRSYLQQLLHVADHIIVTSQKVRDDLRGLGWRTAAHVHVLPLGSTFPEVPPRPCPDERLSLVYVSTVEPRKGHRELLTAFDLLLDEGRDVDLTLVGRSGWASPDLIAAIIGHPEFGGRLRWLDGADDLTMRTTARDACIGLFPSTEEGFGLFLEEGLAMGLKMVVRDIPTFRERAQPNVTFHGPEPEDLAAAIVAAHATPWTPRDRPVRRMSDFHEDLAALILDVVHRERIRASA